MTSSKRVKRLVGNGKTIKHDLYQSTESLLRANEKLFSENAGTINYISSLSFEDRCVAGIKWLLNDQYIHHWIKKGNKLNIVYLVDENTSLNFNTFFNKTNIENLLKKYNLQASFLKCNFHIHRKVINELFALDPEILYRNTYLDISTLSRDLCFTLIQAFEKITPGYILYFEPLLYSQDLSFGLEKINYLQNNHITIDRSKENVLAVMLGHEYKRTGLLIEEINPDRLCLISPNVDEHDTMKHIEWNTIANKNKKKLLAEYQIKSEIEQLYTSSHNPQTILFNLDNLFRKYSERSNLTVVSMGTKIGNLMLETALSNYANTFVLYPKPDDYNVIDYSRGYNPTPSIFALKHSWRIANF